MNIICMINKDTLYEKALKDQVPFFKWYSWIETTINKEVLSRIIKDKKGATKRTGGVASGVGGNVM